MMEDDDLHISRINTAWSMVREAHGDHTAVGSAQQRLLRAIRGAVRKYALSALRNEDAAEDVFQEVALNSCAAILAMLIRNGSFSGVCENGRLSTNR